MPADERASRWWRSSICHHFEMDKYAAASTSSSPSLAPYLQFSLFGPIMLAKSRSCVAVTARVQCFWCVFSQATKFNFITVYWRVTVQPFIHFGPIQTPSPALWWAHCSVEPRARRARERKREMSNWKLHNAFGVRTLPGFAIWILNFSGHFVAEQNAKSARKKPLCH